MSNTDLQQYNGTQAFPNTADVGTNADQFLIPTDGPVITAQSNNTDEGPVYPAFTRLKNLYLGLRGALVGDFPGAVRKTLRALHVDGAGGLTSMLPDGEVWALSHITSDTGDILATAGSIIADVGNLVAVAGDVIATAGAVRAGISPSQNATLESSRLAFANIGAGAGGSNPPQSTNIANELRAKNIPKAAIYVRMDAANAVAAQDGFGCVFGAFVNLSAAVAAVSGTTKGIRIDFNHAFANTNYQIATCGAANPHVVAIAEDRSLRTVNSCVLVFIGFNPVTPVFFGVDPTAMPVSFSLCAHGEQTT